MSGDLETALERRTVVAALLKNRGTLLVVAGLGSSAWDVAAVEDNPLDFPLWGAMGGAAMIGLGLALAQPTRRVLVVTGDGDMMMGIGSLATIGAQRLGNLSIAVLDNERHGETGMQRGLTAAGVDIAGIARASGFTTVLSARDDHDFGPCVSALYGGPGPVLGVFKIKAVSAPRVLPPRDGAYLKDRFRETLLGKAAMR
ncbi:MAG: aldehyde dehydrogenase [Alphaproteobacteria bacterium]|nr:aldehyde dehydrogenase [Alphaproteobacteria bacterium]